MDARSRERIQYLVARIYGREAEPTVSRWLIELLGEREDRLRKSGALRDRKDIGAPLFSERDALLIAYGDMLSGGGGIDVLGDFLSRRAKGLFSFVHLLPFYPYSSDDGFSVIDYRAVDPRVGTWAGVERLGRDFKLAFDLVLNHGSVGSDWFRAFLEGREPYASWYLTRPGDYDPTRVFRPRAHPLLTPFARADGSTVFVWTTFSSDQADFDFSNPDVLLEFFRIFLDYAEHGARLLRLDAIAYLWKEDGTDCLHRPKTHLTVKLFRAAADALGLDLVILTETNVPHEENLSYFGDGDEAHMVYNFALPPLLLHAAVSGDAQPLRRWAKTLPAPDTGRILLNFTASHDGIGVGPARGLIDDGAFARTMEETVRRGGKISFKDTPTGPIPYELNCSYLDAVSPPDAAPLTRARAFLATQAAMLALAGVPAVYFHSWIGSRNWTAGPETLGYNRAINREKPEAAEVEAEISDPTALRFLVHSGLKRLLEFRSERPAFSPDSPQRVLDTEGAAFALVRGPDKNGNTVLCAHNLAPYPITITAPEGFGSLKLELSPWQTRWRGSDGGEVCI